jgi:hypothetical protein
MQDQREDKEGDVEAGQPGEKEIRVMKQAEKGMILPPDTGRVNAAIGTAGFIPADEAAAVGAELRGFAGRSHMGA